MLSKVSQDAFIFTPQHTARRKESKETIKHKSFPIKQNLHIT